jgi:phosphohistidine phosphatase
MRIVPDEQSTIAQAAAIPFRRDRAQGEVHVLLIRRKNGGAWGIPKGHIDPGLTAAQSAVMEAQQEAGVEGELWDGPNGTFTYEKQGRVHHVQVYPMNVTNVLSRWDEDSYRERQWFEICRAARDVGRAAVGALIDRLADTLQGP